MKDSSSNNHNTKVFIISDTHFEHANVIEYAGRPFNNVEEMNETIIKNWNQVVGENNVVIHLGDFAFGGYGNVEKFINKLNGRVILIKGNHDYSLRQLQTMNFFRVVRNLVYNDIFFTHKPVSEIELDRRKMAVNFHGHVHEKSELDNGTRWFNFSVEAINYIPHWLGYFDVSKFKEIDRSK